MKHLKIFTVVFAAVFVAIFSALSLSQIDIKPIKLEEKKLSENHKKSISNFQKGKSKHLGESNPMSVLTNNQVKEICGLIKERLRGVKIAQLFDVNPQTIYDIKNGKTYKIITQNEL